MKRAWKHQSATTRYTIVGMAIGFLFPLAGTLIETLNREGSISLNGLVRSQATSALLWIIDTAPVVLAIFAGIAGKRQEKVEQLFSKLQAYTEEQETIGQAILKSNQFLLIAMDLEGRIRTINETVKRLIGEVEGARPGDRFPGNLLKIEETQWRKKELASQGINAETPFELITEKVRQTGLPEEQEWTCQISPQHSFPLLISVSPVLDKEKKLKGYICVGKDMSKLKRAEAGLLESESRLTQILKTIPLGVFVMDTKGDPYFFNEKTLEILGVEEMIEVPGEDLSRTYKLFRTGTNEYYPVENLPLIRALGGEIVYTADLEIEQKGKRIPLEIWASPIFDRNGLVTFSVAAFNDFSERRAAERLTEEHARELEKINSELDQFAYVVSHDLKAPLRGIGHLTRWIQEDLQGKGGAEIDEKLQLLESRANRLQQLIMGVLAYSRAGRPQNQTQELDLKTLIREIWDDQAPPPGFELELAGSFPRIWADRSQMTQLFGNLLSNSIKFNDKKTGKVTVHSTITEAQMELLVKDNGPGIPDEWKEKVFGIFQRLPGDSHLEGTGIGLSIVKKIINENDGKITLENGEESGATFRIILPLTTPSRTTDAIKE